MQVRTKGREVIDNPIPDHRPKLLDDQTGFQSSKPGPSVILTYGHGNETSFAAFLPYLKNKNVSFRSNSGSIRKFPKRTPSAAFFDIDLFLRIA